MSVGHQGNLVGDDLVHQVHEGGNRVAFDVEFGGHERADDPHVAVPDMPLVRAGMDSDAFRAETFAVQGRLRHVRHVAAAGVADGCYLVDIYT